MNLFVVILVGLLSLLSTAYGQQPISLSAENPHYFQYKGKPLVLITSAEHYGAVLNTEFDYEKYLLELKSKYLNLTRTFSGVYCEPPGSFNIAMNTLAPLPGKFLTPWARSSEPGYRNGGNKFDLGKWDENYFVRLRHFLQRSADNDIIVEFTLFCPFYEDTMWIYSPMHPGNNINNTPDIPRTDVYTLDKNGKLFDIQKRLVEKLVAELNQFDNLIFEICNEPYFGGVTLDWQHAIADLIIATEKKLPKKHLISQNIANGSSLIKAPHPGISVFNYHYAYPPFTVQHNYHLNKVIGDNETGFRGTSDSTYRFEGWRFVMARGGLYNNLDYSFTTVHETGNFRYPENQPGGGSVALRKQLKTLREFLEKFDFVRMTPDSTLFDPDTSRKIIYNALSQKEKQYAIYFRQIETPRVYMNVPEGRYKVQWLFPDTGEYSSEKTLKTKNGQLLLSVPAHKADLALRVLKIR